MAEEEKKVETPAVVPEMPKETAPEKRYSECLKVEQLPFELIGQKVRVWTHHQANQCLEGRVKCIAGLYMVIKEQQGAEKYVWYSAGPILHVLEY